jgi:transposase-like protein
MSQEVPSTIVVKKRQRRCPEMIAQLIWEAERTSNVAEICRRESVTPSLFYRWRQRHKEAGIEGLKAAKRGPKGRDLEKEQLQGEVARLKSALLQSTMELLLLKKSVSSD